MAVRERASLRNVYLYLVCLITLVMAIFAAVSIVRNVAELVYPDPGAFAFEIGPREDGLTEEQREEQRRAQQDSARRQAVLGLISGGATLLIAGPVYAYHWRKIESELPGREPAESGAQ